MDNASLDGTAWSSDILDHHDEITGCRQMCMVGAILLRAVFERHFVCVLRLVTKQTDGLRRVRCVMLRLLYFDYTYLQIEKQRTIQCRS